MKDQYVIKLNTELTMGLIEETVVAVREEISKNNAYRLNANSFTLPTTMGRLPNKCIAFTTLSRMVAEREVRIAFRSVLEKLYGEEYASKAKTCHVKRVVSTFIVPNVGSSWLKAEVIPGTTEYKRLFGEDGEVHIVDISAVRRLVMEVEIENVTYYGITHTVFVADKAGRMCVSRFGCVVLEEEIEKVKKYLDSEMRVNRWEENQRYDEVMSYHGVISPLRERIYYAYALKTNDESALPPKVMAYLETMNELLMQVAQMANQNQPTKAGNISLN